MDDLHTRISDLVAEEHRLRSDGAHDASNAARLHDLEQQLDQCWDLLRRRDALRSAGQDPDAATPRPTSEVEGYLQ